MVNVFSMPYSVRRGTPTGQSARRSRESRSIARCLPLRLAPTGKVLLLPRLEWEAYHVQHVGLVRLSGSRALRRQGQRGLGFSRNPRACAALFENLETGATIDQFLEWFPGVTPGQVVAVLEHTEQSLAEV